MAKQHPRAVMSLRRPLSEAAQKRLEEIRARLPEIYAEIEADRPAIEESARLWKAEFDAALAPVREIAAALWTDWERQGLGLSDLQDRTGIPEDDLRLLENGLRGDLSVSLLLHIARQAGKELRITLAERTQDVDSRGDGNGASAPAASELPEQADAGGAGD